MFREYLCINLSQLQKNEVNNFNNNPKIFYETLINCEVCNSKKFTILFNNDRYGINQKTCVCNNCGFIFSNPRMAKSSAEFFYNSDLYRKIYEDTDKEDLFINTLKEMRGYMPNPPKKPNFNKYYYTLYFDFINNEINDFETVMDIGCGKGKKLLDFRLINKKSFGIEPSNIYSGVHKELGLNTKIGFIESVKEKYDLVILSHVLEHLSDLEKNIKNLYNISKKYVFIEVPGHISKHQSIQNAHNYYFSINTLNYFFIKNKFKPIKVEYAKDNEFILALYEKTNHKVDCNFDKYFELKMVRKITRKYFYKYILIKTLKFIRLENFIRQLFNKSRFNA